MGILFAQSKEDVQRFGWLFLFFFLVPCLLLVLLYWKIYFEREVHLVSMAVSCVVSIPLLLTLASRTRRLISSGLHPTLRSAHALGIKHYLASWLCLFILIYGWGLVFSGLSLVVATSEEQTKKFQVKELSECRGKCSGCAYRVILDTQDTMPFNKVCASAETWKTLALGDVTNITGYYAPYASYITSVTRGGSANSALHPDLQAGR